MIEYTSSIQKRRYLFNLIFQWKMQAEDTPQDGIGEIVTGPDLKPCATILLLKVTNTKKTI